MAAPTYEDVNLILRIYELRRDEKMREARDWFAGNFNATTLEESNRLCPPGSETNRYLRMVTSYWEMVASFIACGVLNEDLFFQSGFEMLLVYERLRPLIPELRAAMRLPMIYKNLETVCERYAEHVRRTAPEGYDLWVTRIRELAAKK